MIDSASNIVRRCYSAFFARDRETMERLFADTMTFSSPRDDHIGKAEYFQRCWPNGDRLASFELERIAELSDVVFIQYTAVRVADGVRFRNVEVIRVEHGKIQEIDVYFGRDL